MVSRVRHLIVALPELWLVKDDLTFSIVLVQAVSDTRAFDRSDHRRLVRSGDLSRGLSRLLLFRSNRFVFASLQRGVGVSHFPIELLLSLDLQVDHHAALLRRNLLPVALML